MMKSQDPRYSYQIKKTEFITQKQNSDPDGVTLQLLQSTCLLNYPMNRNNVLQGNSIIYINGAYITFYNFFQNSKNFATNASLHKPLGMAGSNTGRGNVAIVSQAQDKSQLQICVYTFLQQFVPTYTIKQKLTFIDLVMIQSSLIIVAAVNQQKQNLIFIINNRHTTQINLQKERKIKRLVGIDHKIYVLFENGGMYFLDTEKYVIRADVMIEHQDKIIDDYCEVDNQYKIILYQSGIIYCYWVQNEKQFILDFRADFPNCKGHRLIKVGRNILVAHRNSLTISHFIIGQDNIIFIGNHTYYQNLAAGIISVQSSQDEMHAVLAVQITQKQQVRIQNFIFNLSSISKTHKFMNPFNRIMSMGADIGNFRSMENVLSSNSFVLIGQKIFSFFCSSTLEKKKMFTLIQTPKFMTVHPLGYQFLCGFDNIIKFYNKVQKDMQQIWTQQYICTAAKYSKSGGLVLSCIQDSFTCLILYDCYNFRRIRNIPIPLLKMYPTKIDWVQNNSTLVLSTKSEIIKINISTGQKISQFRQKKQTFVIKCVDYDVYNDKVIAGTNSNSFIVSSKSQDSGHSLNNHRVVSFMQQITCIKISHGLKTIFFGTKKGVLYWYSYPLRIKSTTNSQGHNTWVVTQQPNSLKLHNDPITSIQSTNNSKFMIVNIKGQGYFSLKVRKIRTKENGINGNMNIVFQELGNPILNTIDTSSSINYNDNKDRLKVALEKRKECFSNLEEFRRDWQLKAIVATKKNQIQSKKDELSFINQTLQKLQMVKQDKKKIKADIQNQNNQIQNQKTKKQQEYHKQMLVLFDEQMQQNQTLGKKKKQYSQQYQKFVQQCNQNIKQIQQDLSQKRQIFERNYRMMLQNLQNFSKRIQFQKQAEKQQRYYEHQQNMKKLELKQIQLNNLSNDLSVKITQCKKQYQRYSNRQSFLQFKNKFFKSETQRCLQEKGKLLQLKQKLETQLKQLQIYTDKKQKKLRIYLKANQALRKYKQIHENLSQNSLKQAQFIKSQKQKIDLNIVEVQKQLSNIASTNQAEYKQISNLEQQEQIFKKTNYDLQIRIKDIGYYLTQILNAMDNIGYCKSQSQRSVHLKKIYQFFYVQKSVQRIIQAQTKNQPNYEKHLLQYKNEKLRSQQTKIINELNDQKQYILKNIQVFKNFNKKVNEQINLNHVKIQAQNYNLIAQCNLRKQQTANKKKVLHQLIDSVKQTQIYLDQLKKQGTQKNLLTRKSKKSQKKRTQVPFVLYQRAKEQLTKMKCQQALTSYSTNAYTNSRPETSNKLSHTKYNVRKMLDVKGFGQNGQQKIGFRRIQTATNKRRSNGQVDQQQQNQGVMKPLTATFKRRIQRQTLKSAISIKSKNNLTKSNSNINLSRAKFNHLV